MKCETEFNGAPHALADKTGKVLWLVDDSDAFREIIAENFSYESGIDCARQFPSAEAMLAALKTDSSPDVILMDVNMGGMKGVDAVAPVKKIAPQIRVLIFTTFYDSHDALTAFRAGASGFLLKSYDFERVARAVADTNDLWPESWFRLKAKEADDAKAAVGESTDSKPAPSISNLASRWTSLLNHVRESLRREPATFVGKLANLLF